MITIKSLVCFALALLLVPPVAPTNDCCPWTRFCKCQNGRAIFADPWECVNNTLTHRKADISTKTDEATNYTVPIGRPEISCARVEYFALVVLLGPLIFLVFGFWFCSMYTRSAMWIYRNEQDVEGQQNEAEEIRLQERRNRPINEDYSGFPVSLFY